MAELKIFRRVVFAFRHLGQRHGLIRVYHNILAEYVLQAAHTEDRGFGREPVLFEEELDASDIGGRWGPGECSAGNGATEIDRRREVDLGIVVFVFLWRLSAGWIVGVYLGLVQNFIETDSGRRSSRGRRGSSGIGMTRGARSPADHRA
jgi:hypothetical protein